MPEFRAIYTKEVCFCYCCWLLFFLLTTTTTTTTTLLPRRRAKHNTRHTRLRLYAGQHSYIFYHSRSERAQKATAAAIHAHICAEYIESSYHNHLLKRREMNTSRFPSYALHCTVCVCVCVFVLPHLSIQRQQQQLFFSCCCCQHKSRTIHHV